MEELDDTFDLNENLVEVSKNIKTQEDSKSYKKETKEEKPLINCLRNARVIVRFIKKPTGLVTNPKHVLYGGMAETAVRSFVVPKLSSGMFVNILTDSEKDYLEYIMGLEPNALSIYKKVDNFWDDSNDNGISRVRLTKQDNFLNLADPEDYIRYKILLANKNHIAPSLQALQDYPKATYQFVLIEEGEEIKQARSKMDITMECYKEYGKIEDEYNLLRVIVESLDGRPTALNTKIEFLQSKINDYIQSDAKTFLKVIKDPYLKTKSLIKQCVEEGLISRRGDQYYLKSDNSPLCFDGDSTLTNAAKYLDHPKNQDLKFSLEAKTK